MHEGCLAQGWALPRALPLTIKKKWLIGLGCSLLLSHSLGFNVFFFCSFFFFCPSTWNWQFSLSVRRLCFIDLLAPSKSHLYVNKFAKKSNGRGRDTQPDRQREGEEEGEREAELQPCSGLAACCCRSGKLAVDWCAHVADVAMSYHEINVVLS